ncbi:hypothetical protein [Aneurinibacillus aneurinilyticus]|uniref:hypothetical protein n=2 Tax=Aneurinibacillus aneurinilyticus TaxID=1391 RepID=UPI0023F533C7|nr:hypothetical protein [Aneurinibacillus aneurinilyticus]
MSVIHAYLAKSSNPYSHERLAFELSTYFDFETSNGLKIETSVNPFTNEKYVVLRWSGWNFLAHFETGRNVPQMQIMLQVWSRIVRLKSKIVLIAFALYSRLMRDEISRISSFGR